MAEFRIRSIEGYGQLDQDLKGFNEGVIQAFLDLEGEVTIIRKSISTRMDRVYIHSKKVEEITEKVKIILGDDFKKNIEKEITGDEQPIEELRKEILKIKAILGGDWDKEQEYLIDRYKQVNEWINGQAEDFDISQIAEKVEDGKVFLGRKLVEILKLHKKESGKITDYIMNKSKKIDIDFKGYEVDILLYKPDTEVEELTVRNARCSSLGNGLKAKKVVIERCSVDNLLPNAKVGECLVRGCILMNNPFDNAKTGKRDVKETKIIMDIFY